MKGASIFQIVKKQIDTIDLYGLLAGGAPQDEFDIESAMIANEQFSDHLSAGEFMLYAAQIEKFLNT